MKSVSLIEVTPEELSDIIKKATTAALTEFSGQPSSGQKTNEPFLTSEDILEELKISPTTLTQWIKDKRIPYHRFGRRLYFKRSELALATDKRHKKGGLK